METNEEEIDKIFDIIDVNKTGFIDFTEFVMASINKKTLYAKDRIKTIFKMIDTDNSGTLSKKELKEFFFSFDECGNE